jgi:plastocyanin
MKTVIAVLVGLVVLGGLVGYVYYNGGEEQGGEELTGEKTNEMVEIVGEDEVKMDSVGSQFIQQVPGSGPPTDEEVGESGDAEEPETEEDLVRGEEIVSITDLGFVPETVTVSVGTEVTFINNGQGMHWPVSDSYLINTPSGLRGFDAGHGLSTGEEYSFVFTQRGRWDYRDNLNVSLTGTIIVE